ncbi:ABC-three component system middle component 6 [Lactococcus garvieae]|uniref:Uncharacterized protein n=1 Tax=Lactococcus garvieae TaxID=1363 RepID=A0AA46YT83_9LACT|nr:ABC-three component system middle component 6 [Lactococcus garvieae]UYT10394.1 hypothetical protein OF801_00200 [Lactococcus garvieae]UYT12435.1 hypothetical protein OF800_00205 [Lactococcus garvieae]
MIIDRDSRPVDTVYYTSAYILNLVSKKSYQVEKLYEELKRNCNSELDYTIFILALDFLFLLEKVDFSLEGDLICLSNS